MMQKEELERIQSVEIERLDGYRFRASFDDSMPPVTMDEPAPLGAASAPDAARILGAAIGDCLSASLLLCLQKSRVSVSDLRASVKLTLGRNEHGRLRVSGGTVRISVTSDAEPAKLERCTRMFEDYCVVTATVRRAFPVAVEVVDGSGHEIYRSADESAATPV